MKNNTKESRDKQKNERLGITKLNNDGDLMKIVEYNSYYNIIVEFQDEHKERVNSRWDSFKKGSIRNPHYFNRIGIQKLNNQGCLMKCIEYNGYYNVVIEFQDEFKYRTKINWGEFNKGEIRNPYFKQIFGVGMTGIKYPVKINNKNTKEYSTWYNMLRRCFDKKVKERNSTYKDVTCCKEWLLFENFYEWLHSQENFDKWINLNRSDIDKDILIKGNKIYSPDTCCLVPHNINGLFCKSNATRGNLPIGVRLNKNKSYTAECCINNNNSQKFLGDYDTPEEAFYVYKEFKENLIKQIAQEEYNKGNITKKCYDAMMNYQVEITD